MPDRTKYDWNYRPDSYWDKDETWISNIMGEVRRKAIEKTIEEGSYPLFPGEILNEELSPELRHFVGRIHPQYMGGEYLPGYLPGEVEIARVALNSIMLDVTSIRARRVKGMILYRVVDEYATPDEPRLKWHLEASPAPLSFGELVSFIDNAEAMGSDGDFIRGLGTAYLESNFRISPDAVNLEQLADFVEVRSLFYPQLEEWYEEVIQEWFYEKLYEVNGDEYIPCPPPWVVSEEPGKPVVSGLLEEGRPQPISRGDDGNSEDVPTRDDRLADRIRGCLLGVAIGDALGNPFEHLGPGPQKGILGRTGGYITDFHPGQGFPAGAWTDDTGMTLALCRALVEVLKTYRTLEECVRSAFEFWAGSGECRKPGKTVLHASKYGCPFVDSWANGALMRTSPIAIYAHLMGFGRQEAASLAYRVARTTHGHPLATFPTVEAVLALMSIFSGEERPPEGISDPGRWCRYAEPEKNARYDRYKEKRHVPLGELEASSGLWMWRFVFENSLDFGDGAGWDQMPEFEPGILKVINCAVDKDTAGAVAGALLGAHWGESGIPEKWRTKVEKADAIVGLADGIIAAAGKR